MFWLADWPELQGERALDVATGSGRLALALAARFGEVVGLDGPEALERATPGPGVRFVAGDAEALPFEDASFDAVTIAWALHHLANPTRVLMEMRRVLKPGGYFLMAEPIRLLQGTNQDVHVLAHGLLGRLDRARGKAHFPLFERLQVGSVIQGLGLVDLAFRPALADPVEAEWDLERCREAAAPWIEKLAVGADDPEVAAVIARLREEGLRTGPVHVVGGRVPHTP